MDGTKITAWRDGAGTCGVTISHVEPIGDDNVVCKLRLVGADEVGAFLSDCSQAWQRGRAFTEQTHEPIPGPYDDGWYDD